MVSERHHIKRTYKCSRTYIAICSFRPYKVTIQPLQTRKIKILLQIRFAGFRYIITKGRFFKSLA